ncbi:MAG: 2OG-Fe(II) oxygenase [Alphaproteobacteria bacterium]|nr:2OG-Fe(II) oxygenase [Alphaproteobacteria bacterium]
MSPVPTVSVQARPLDGRQVHVVDGLFAADVVRLLHEAVKRLPFALSDRDSEETDHIRHWRRDFAPESFAASPLLRVLHDRVVAKTAELLPEATGKLVETYSNNHGYGDHPHAHTDRADGVTDLYYANSDWQPDWQCETTLYDRAGEPYYTVAPKPGRLLIFPADVLHRGGTPSRTCNERRLVVVFKFVGPGASR